MIHRLIQAAACALLAFGFASAKAINISLEPTSILANLNKEIALDLTIDLSGDLTLGEVLKSYTIRSLLAYQSFTTSTATLSLDDFFSHQSGASRPVSSKDWHSRVSVGSRPRQWEA